MSRKSFADSRHLKNLALLICTAWLKAVRCKHKSYLLYFCCSSLYLLTMEISLSPELEQQHIHANLIDVYQESPIK